MPQGGRDVYSGPAQYGDTNNSLLLKLLYWISGGKGVATGGTGGSAGIVLAQAPYTPAAAINLANGETKYVPVTLAQWTVAFFGTGTANSFQGGTVTAPFSISGTGKPATPIAVVCDASSTATIIGSTT